MFRCIEWLLSSPFWRLGVLCQKWIACVIYLRNMLLVFLVDNTWVRLLHSPAISGRNEERNQCKACLFETPEQEYDRWRTSTYDHLYTIYFIYMALRLVASMRGRASVNSVAMATLKLLYPYQLDVGCFSHTLDRGPVADEFTRLWISLFSWSLKALLAWRSYCGVAIPTHWEQVVELMGGNEANTRGLYRCWWPPPIIRQSLSSYSEEVARNP